MLLTLWIRNTPWMQTYSLGIDPSFERCLPDVHLTLLKKIPPTRVQRGDLVFFKPGAHFIWVKTDYILKKVAGVEGDHLVIKDNKVFINEREIARGFPLAQLYKGVEFKRDEIIPKGAIFLYGTHPLSDDSRYWGFESVAHLDGQAYEIF